MIAMAMLEAFRQFLRDPGGVLPRDAINHELKPYDSDAERAVGLGYLDPQAMPDDPDKACIIGVIDDAMPFAHESLRTESGHSRVAAYWAQDAVHDPAAPVGGDLPSGVELRGQMIDALLERLGAATLPDEDALYRRAGTVDFARPQRHSAAYEAGHGASVLGLAARFDPWDARGRNHPVLAVGLPARVSEDSMGVLAPLYILASIMFIITRARRLCRMIEDVRGLPAHSVKMPVVINISYGISAGPRDGSTLLERFIDAVSTMQASDLGPIRFVLPMGNHRQARLVGVGRRGDQVGWRIQPDDLTHSAVEIWGPRHRNRPERPFAIHLAAPGMEPVATVFSAHGQMSLLRDATGAEIARAYYQSIRGEGGRWREGITVIAPPTCPGELGQPYAPPGDWAIRIDPSAPSGAYEISVQRDETIHGFHREARQSRLEDPRYTVREPNDRAILLDLPSSPGQRPIVRRRGTISAYAGGRAAIRAGSANGLARGASFYSGLNRGGSSGDVQTFVDPSDARLGTSVQGRDSGARRYGTGTSMSAPQITRWLAATLANGTVPNDRAAAVALADAVSRGLAGAVPILPSESNRPEF
ncbi:hypothetical protein MLD63_02690 (plasmid) [Paracoccus sp. TK19116]|uniref:Peptidase S8/S53 domain-containing protein n=1 Tax=Paracoccus albicereus TaxID=2922394 RepID=A0ABT1MM30_9RHOB|nr:hypothetical protein [Paracoccus albicereus]MCQ0969345.1 hypothetical protein [Paracoccus albicereus]